MRKFRLEILLIVSIALAFILLSCSSGGGSGSDAPSSSGTAAVFIKDAPTPEYDHIFLCISKATLEPGSVTLFESDDCVRIDLLDLQEKPFLLTVKDIPTGKYNQIRLNVDEVLTDGGDCDDLDIKIPSGVVKVNFQGPITVKSGDKLGFEIDIQANKSLGLHGAGNSRKCIFRPVIIATVTNLGDIPPGNKCPRMLNGRITEIRKVDGEVKGFRLRLSHDTKSRINIRVNDDTAIFDENGDFTTPDVLEVGQRVKVRGEVKKDASVLASVVAIGDLIKLHGIVTENISEYEFEMELAPGQVVIDQYINVILDDQTLILANCKTEVDRSEIIPGIGVRAIGKLSEGDLISFALFLEKKKAYGLITSMLPVDNGHEIEFIPAGETEEITLFLPESEKVFLEGDGYIDKDELVKLINCQPRKARIVWREGDPEVIDFVEVKDEVIEGVIESKDYSSYTITLKDKQQTLIQLQFPATIIKDGDLIKFKKLQPGDEIRVFGLEDCLDEDYDFYGLVVLVTGMLDRGDEGCSQGYWKNHTASWGLTDYNTYDRYEDVFGVPYEKTLLQALNSGGGGQNALGRQAVAALLNASHPSVDYFYAEDEVIEIVQDAYDTGDYERAKDLLEEHTSPCPLD